MQADTDCTLVLSSDYISILARLSGYLEGICQCTMTNGDLGVSSHDGRPADCTSEAE